MKVGDDKPKVAANDAKKLGDPVGQYVPDQWLRLKGLPQSGSLTGSNIMYTTNTASTTYNASDLMK